ncbi:MAG: fibronectin type III domain-containing protein [Desulfobacterales bacterium]|nr:fibronectin type III domain-containing protein [Desulfobacterales bacterium]
MNVSPSGSGSITSSDWSGNPTSYPAVYTCSQTYSLTAVHKSGYVFDRWGGSFSGTSNPLSVSVADGPKSVTAYFKLNDGDGDGYSVNEGDCDDQDPDVHPGAVEICGDNKDNNCNGAIDEGCSQTISPPSSAAVKPKSSTQIALGWKDNSNNETGFIVEKKKGNCDSATAWTQVTTKSSNAATHTVSGLTPDTAYAFRVRAYNDSEESASSNCAAAKTAKTGTPPAPTNLKATSASSTTVNLSWQDNSAENGFKIYRKIGTGAWTLLKTTGAEVKSFKDTAAENNTLNKTYSYYVAAFNDSGNSPSTNMATVPYQPLNLTVSQSAGSGSVQLTWTDKSANETGYEIWRKSGDCSSTADWVKVASAAANKNSWTDTSCNPDITYAYKIRAYKKSGSVLPGYGYSAWSPCKSATAP